MQQNLLALIIGGLGAFLAYVIHLPLWVLTGPALAVSLAGLAGVKTDISGPVRQAAFLLMGLGVGTSVTPQAAAFLIKTPPAFAMLVVMLVVIMLVCQRTLIWMGYSSITALLASSPGHLSFVLAIAQDKQHDISAIAIIQMIRILVLMFSLPIVVLLMGVPIPRDISLDGQQVMPLLHLPVLGALGAGVGYVFFRLRFPAALVLSGMAVSATAQLCGVTTGAMPGWLTILAFGIIGCLIGTRFSGVSPQMVMRYLGTGVVTTLLTVAIALVFAWGTAWMLGIPVVHALITMAPGGLETMVGMGAILGVNSSFVAAMHVWRLLVLTVLVPVFYKWLE